MHTSSRSIVLADFCFVKSTIADATFLFGLREAQGPLYSVPVPHYRDPAGSIRRQCSPSATHSPSSPTTRSAPPSRPTSPSPTPATQRTSLNTAPPARRRVARLDSLLGSRSVRARLILRLQAPIALRFPPLAAGLLHSLPAPPCSLPLRGALRRIRPAFLQWGGSPARLTSPQLLPPSLSAPSAPSPLPALALSPALSPQTRYTFLSCLCRPPGAGKYTDFYL